MWGGRRKKVGEREEGVGSAGEPASARPRAAAAARTVAGGGGGRRRQPGEGCGRRRGVPPESPTRATRGEGESSMMLSFAYGTAGILSGINVELTAQ